MVFIICYSLENQIGLDGSTRKLVNRLVLWSGLALKIGEGKKPVKNWSNQPQTSKIGEEKIGHEPVKRVFDFYDFFID